jgi:hypothetical protein
VKSKKKRDDLADYLMVLEEIPQDYLFLSKNSKVFNYKSRYPIILLDYNDKEGTWLKLKKSIDKLESRSEQIFDKEVEEYLDDHPEIDFEHEMFNDIIQDSFYFKIDNDIYCYSIKEISETHMMVRFFFDVQKFID